MTEKAKPSLHAALLDARAAVGPFVKDADNPFYKSKYVTLDTILGRVVPILTANRLCLYGRAEGGQDGGAVVTATDKNGAGIVIETARGTFVTSIVHADTGEAIEDRRPFVGVQSAQQMGAASSYSFRYGIAALLALELTDEDDDGHAASAGTGQGRPASAPPKPATAPARPTTAPTPSRPAKGQGAGPAGGKPCPKCGAVGMVRIVKTGPNAGLWECAKWAEKGWNGCGSKWTYDPNGTSPQALANTPLPSERVATSEQAAILEQPGRWSEPEPSPLDPDELPF